MHTPLPIRCENATRQETLTAHMWAVERTIQTMHTHLQERLSLEDLASVACLSPFHFHRIFRHLIGITPGEFLSALRLQEARSLLVTTSLSVTDICFTVGYSSIGSFTSRFTSLVGISPRLLRQRAHTFEPPTAVSPSVSPRVSETATLLGQISVPASFQGIVYVGLFSSPIPQGVPVRCTRVSTSQKYALHNVPDGVYYLRAAAFPATTNLITALLPGEKMLLGNNMSPLIIRHGKIAGNPDLVLHPPYLTDLPLVMGLPLL